MTVLRAKALSTHDLPLVRARDDIPILNLSELPTEVLAVLVDTLRYGHAGRHSLVNLSLACKTLRHVCLPVLIGHRNLVLRPETDGHLTVMNGNQCYEAIAAMSAVPDVARSISKIRIDDVCRGTYPHVYGSSVAHMELLANSWRTSLNIFARMMVNVKELEVSHLSDFFFLLFDAFYGRVSHVRFVEKKRHSQQRNKSSAADLASCVEHNPLNIITSHSRANFDITSVNTTFCLDLLNHPDSCITLQTLTTFNIRALRFQFNEYAWYGRRGLTDFMRACFSKPEHLRELHIGRWNPASTGHDTTPSHIMDYAIECLRKAGNLRRLCLDSATMVQKCLPVLSELICLTDLKLHSPFRASFCSDCCTPDTHKLPISWLDLPNLRLLSLRFLCDHLRVSQLLHPGLTSLAIEYYNGDTLLREADLRQIALTCPHLKHLAFDPGHLDYFCENIPHSGIAHLKNLETIALIPNYWQDGHLEPFPSDEPGRTVTKIYIGLRAVLPRFWRMIVHSSYGEYPYDVISRMNTDKRPWRTEAESLGDGKVRWTWYSAGHDHYASFTGNADQDSEQTCKQISNACTQDKYFEDYSGWELRHRELLT